MYSDYRGRGNLNKFNLPLQIASNGLHVVGQIFGPIAALNFRIFVKSPPFWISVFWSNRLSEFLPFGQIAFLNFRILVKSPFWISTFWSNCLSEFRHFSQIASLNFHILLKSPFWIFTFWSNRLSEFPHFGQILFSLDEIC